MPKTDASILIVDDDPAVRTAAQMFLKQLFSVVITAGDPARVPGLMDEMVFDVILLDNLSTEQMRKAVAMRDEAGLAGKVQLEASGQISLDNVRAAAETGVERISVGAITHSAGAVDIALDIEIN